jgi:hypothetical protein
MSWDDVKWTFVSPDGYGAELVLFLVFWVTYFGTDRAGRDRVGVATGFTFLGLLVLRHFGFNLHDQYLAVIVLFAGFNYVLPNKKIPD